ncbi:hypothetical protein ES703_118563 [subsurface metagenome]
MLPKGGKVTRRSIIEYAGAVRGRYFRASKKTKAGILNEFVATTGMRRKSAIRLLNRTNSSSGKKRGGRPRLYGLEAMAALKVVWEATDRLCSKRLHPFLPELVAVMRRHGDRTMTTEIEAQLCKVSPATIDRILRPYRRLGGRHPFTTTKPGSLLKRAIPVRTFSEWDEKKPVFLEADLVAHCGDSTEGFYLTTLSTVDVASGWSECVGVWGKGQERVGWCCPPCAGATSHTYARFRPR